MESAVEHNTPLCHSREGGNPELDARLQSSGMTGKSEIDKGQIKKIHTLEHALKLTKEEYGDRIMEKHGFSRSCKDLSYDEAEQLIKAWEQEAMSKGVWATGKEKYEDLDNRQGMAAPSKLRMIEAMWVNISYVHDAHKREQALRKFLFKIAHVDDLAFLTADGADKVINALRHIKGRHGNKSYKSNSTYEPQVYRDRSNNF
ncbi:MAG: hypothetical protein FD156_1188 [Nitrospirae bacterium]|nr:MAG: hypothetical protein FD156_1188 [Nitrospirota bacterium]